MTIRQNGLKSVKFPLNFDYKVPASVRTELDVADVKSSLRSVMWRKVGIERHDDRLAETREIIAFWSRYVMDKTFHPSAGGEANATAGWELQNMLTGSDGGTTLFRRCRLSLVGDTTCMPIPENAPEAPETADGRFALTRWSVVLAAGGGEPAARGALEILCRNYWYPLYAFVRRQGHQPHDAQDLTQEFFARLLERGWLDGVDRKKGKFRSFLLASMKHFLSNQRDRAAARKRGGCRPPISLDTHFAESRYALEPLDIATPEKIFERRWALTLLEQVLGLLRDEMASRGNAALFDELKATCPGNPRLTGKLPADWPCRKAPSRSPPTGSASGTAS
jgi:RNA polymerase sigma-70 factor (ECF subfamily)